MVASPSVVSRLPDGGRFVALDSWRGLAALGVAAFHIEGGGPLFETRPVIAMNAFVDFFFVLSGFVLAAAYGERLAQGFPLGRFALLRLGRVYPLHLVMVLAYVAIELVFLIAGQAGWALREPFTGVRSPQVLVSSLLLIGPWHVPPLQNYNAASWSIEVEVWLYLALALALRWGGRIGWWLLPAAAIVALAALAVPHGYVWMSKPLLRGLAGFGLGVGLWRMRSRWPAAGPALSPGASGAAELACVALMVAVLTWLPDGRWVLAVRDLTFVLVVLVFAAERGIVSRLLQTRPFVRLGVLSYSLYMVHGLVLGRLADGLRWVGYGKLVPAGDRYFRAIDAAPWTASLIGCLMLLGCLPVAWLAWRLVENPARQWSRRQAARWGAGKAETAAPTI